MKKILLALGLPLLATGCATPFGPAEVAALHKEIRSVTFVQNGTTPAVVTAGVVDGKTFWTNGLSGVSLTPQNPNNPQDVRGAAEGNAVVLAGSLIAKAAMADDPDYHNRTVRAVLGERDLPSEMAATVLPEFANAWGFTFDRKKVQVRQGAPAFPGADNVYGGEDPGTDLVLAFTVDQFVITEKPTLKSLAYAFSFGAGDRQVIPVISASLAAYKRDPAGQLKRIWRQDCLTLTQQSEQPDESFAALAETPAKGKPLVDAAVPVATNSCKKVLDGFRRAPA